MREHAYLPGAGRPRDVDREDRDSALVRTAGALFIANGYSGVSLKTIAGEARVAVRTIYARFGGKLGLFEAVIAAERDQLLTDMPASLPDAAPLEKMLAEFCLGYLDLVNSERAIAILRMVISEAGQAPELGRAFYDAGPGAMRDYLTRLLSHPAVRPRFRPALAPELLTGILLSLLLGDSTRRLLHPPPQHNDARQVRNAVATFLAVTTDA